MHGLSIIGLARFIRVASARSDRGAISSIVAVLLGGGVVMGSAALSIDVGNLMWERSQVQNGADSVALSLAQTCASTPAQCNGVTPVTAPGLNLASLNDLNARDTKNGLDPIYLNGLCGRGAGTLPSCAAPPPSPALVNCPALPAFLAANPSIPYVESRTQTRTSAGSAILPGIVAQTLAGGYSGETVRACARAAWGSPGDGTGQGELPLSISACEWRRQTGGNDGGGGGAYYPGPVGAYPGYNGGAPQAPWPLAAPPPPATVPGGEVIIFVGNPPGGATPPAPCPTWQGHALPGGFGLLETVAGNPCKTLEYPYNWMHTSPGSSTSCDLAAMVGRVVSVPVFDCTAAGQPSSAPPVAGQTCDMGNGSNAFYHRKGWAKFYLSGFNVTVTGGAANKKKSLVSNQFPCSGGDSCISGWFVQGSLNATSISGPPSGGGSFGTYTVLPAG